MLLDLLFHFAKGYPSTIVEILACFQTQVWCVRRICASTIVEILACFQTTEDYELYANHHLQQQKFQHAFRPHNSPKLNILSTIVEILACFQTQKTNRRFSRIYNSRNFSMLLDLSMLNYKAAIYNSRNFSMLLDLKGTFASLTIYNSRNFSMLLDENSKRNMVYYLQQQKFQHAFRRTGEKARIF